MDDPFPEQLCQAAKAYPNSCAAHAQFRAGNEYIDLHIQAPEIMMEFVGDVQFGRDPKGRLFYRSDRKWPTVYSIFYYKTMTSSVVVRVDFYAHHGNAGKLRPSARFLARVDASQLPPMVPGLGQGNWKNLKAAICPMIATRRANDTTIYLESRSIHKQAYFTSNVQNSPFSQPGLLFFRVLARLKDKPDDERPCVVDYALDRIVFHLEGRPDSVVALFMPKEPIINIGGVGDKPEATWIDTPPVDDLDYDTSA